MNSSIMQSLKYTAEHRQQHPGSQQPEASGLQRQGQPADILRAFPQQVFPQQVESLAILFHAFRIDSYSDMNATVHGLCKAAFSLRGSWPQSAYRKSVHDAPDCFCHRSKECSHLLRCLHARLSFHEKTLCPANCQMSHDCSEFKFSNSKAPRHLPTHKLLHV